MGVFATRSPFRPNAIGLSCVRLEKVGLHTAFGPVLYVAGADLMDGSPIFDIKPYLAYCDSHPEALEGFTGAVNKPALHVEFLKTFREASSGLQGGTSGNFGAGSPARISE